MVPGNWPTIQKTSKTARATSGETKRRTNLISSYDAIMVRHPPSPLDEEVLATNLGICESCLGRPCLLPLGHSYFVLVSQVRSSRSYGTFAECRKQKVHLYLGDLVVGNISEALATEDLLQCNTEPDLTAKAGGTAAEGKRHLVILLTGLPGCGKSFTGRALQKTS